MCGDPLALQPKCHAKTQRAPSDIFRLLLKSQSVISNDPRAMASRSQIVTLKRGKSMPHMAEDEEGGNRGGGKVQVFNYVPSDCSEKK